MKVAVYGTLKKGFGNNRVMESAEGVLVKEDYIEFSKIRGSGFPVAKFGKGTNKFLLVEVYEVPIRGVTGPLDSLEGYTEGSTWNHYNRIEVITLSGEEVSVYEIASDIDGDNERFFSYEKDGKLFYNWE